MASKKKMRTLIILVVLMIICVGGYFAVSQINFDKEEADETIKLYENIEADDITSMSYDVEGVQYSFSLINDVWYCDSELSANLNQETIGGMLAILASFKSDRVLEVSKDDLKEYGLDKPYKVVSFTTKDGAVHILSVGDKNVNSKYYAYKDDETTVYMIDATINTYFGNTLESLKVEEESAQAE